METLPGDWLSLLILTFVLGMKHGFDADHLATIDGLTRYNARTRPGMARYCGTFFSLGHGAVVMAIALGVSALAGRWEVPEWFGTLGAVISIAFLVALGSLNLAAVLRAEPDQIVQPVGLKGRLLGNLRHVSHPGLVALVGALFALSFDTLSQAAFFALIRAAFSQRRKTAANAIANGLHLPKAQVISALQAAGLDERSRPEQLTLENYCALQTALANT